MGLICNNNKTHYDIIVIRVMRNILPYQDPITDLLTIKICSFL